MPSFVDYYLMFETNMNGFTALIIPKTSLLQHVASNHHNGGILATSSEKNYDLNYYLKSALAGGICCAITHGALT